MKMPLTISLFVLSFASLAQNSIVKVDFRDTYKILRIFDNGFNLYSYNCNDTSLSLLVKRSISEKTSTDITEYSCIHLSDSLIQNRLYLALQEKYKLNKKSCLSYTMVDYSKQDVFCLLFLFTNKKFKQYLRRYNKMSYQFEHQSGEVTMKGANILKYSVGMIARISNSLIDFKIIDE